MIIDAHTHIDDEETYQSYFKKTVGRVDMAFTLHWFKDDLAGLSEFVDSKDNLKLIASLNMSDVRDIDRQLGYIHNLFERDKIVGVKIYPGYQHFYPSDTRVDNVAKLCMQYGKPLVIHTGDVNDNDGEAVLKYSHPFYVDELAIRFPELKIIAAHLGFPNLLECANVVDKNDNVYTDISGTMIDDLPPKIAIAQYKEYKRDLERILNYFPYIHDKIMFGTDYGGEDTPLNEIDFYIKIVKEVFPKDTHDSVFGGLAQELFLNPVK